MKTGQIDRGGARIYFEDRGNGSPVVFSNSFLCSGEMWRHQIAPLSGRCRTINVDCRGQGGAHAGEREQKNVWLTSGRV